MKDREAKPLISVIIPAYNAEATFARACRSVLAQSYPNVELVAVNDGSRDSTPRIMEDLAGEHKNITCIHQENGGVSRARNAGLDAASGELVCFLDADDELEPDALTALSTILEETGADLVAGCCLRVRPDGSSFATRYDISGTTLWHGMEPLENALKDHPATYAVWGKLYRKSVTEGVRFAEGKRIHEDSLFLFELFQKPVKMALTNDVAVRYHMTENSASRAGFSDKFLDILYCAQRKQALIEQNHPQYLDLAKNVQVKASLSLLNNMRKGYDPKYEAVKRACIATVHKNARYFVPAIGLDRVLFWIVRLRLYTPLTRAENIIRRIRK